MVTETTVVATTTSSLHRRQAPTLVKSSWLPVRPFSFFASEHDDAAALIGQGTIGYALWTRLHEQHKEDADLLAFLQARKVTRAVAGAEGGQRTYRRLSNLAALGNSLTAGDCGRQHACRGDD